MRDLDRRLAALESVLGGVVPYSGLARKIRGIDETIHRLDREIAGELATLPPGEAAEARRVHDTRISTLQGLSLDEKIARLDMEIEGIRR